MGSYSHESGVPVIVPLALLSLGSIFSGYLFRDVFVGLGSGAFMESIFVHPRTLFILNAEFIPFGYKTLPLALSLSGICLSILAYSMGGLYVSTF